MSNENTPQDADTRPAVGGPVERMVRPDPARDAFELVVKQWTGRDIAYHYANGTTGLEFAWFCWQQAAKRERELCAAICDGVRDAADHAARDGHRKAGAMASAATCAKLIRAQPPS